MKKNNLYGVLGQHVFLPDELHLSPLFYCLIKIKKAAACEASENVVFLWSVIFPSTLKYVGLQAHRQ